MYCLADEILHHLKPLVGLKLARVDRVLDMCVLDFGEARPTEKGDRYQYALHIQCPWRIEGADGIVTGRADLWEPAEAGADVDPHSEDWLANENLQDKLVHALFGDGTGVPPPGSEKKSLFVEDVQADNCGGITIKLTGNYQLVVFPAGSTGEDWRFYQPGRKVRHFVIAGGRQWTPAE